MTEETANTPSQTAGAASPNGAAKVPVNDNYALRGALKLEVSASTPVVSAGTEFSIYVVIRNPFPVPVTIHSTETHIPVELSDELWRKQEQQKRQQEYNEQYNNEKTLSRKILLALNNWARNVYEGLQPSPSPRVAIAFSPEVQDLITRVKPNIYINEAVNVQRDFIGGNMEQWNLTFEGVPEKEIWRILYDINEYRTGRVPVVLLPGNSVVQHFVLKTTNWLTFTPIAHTFQIQVRYEMDGNKHIDTVPYALSIRAATASSLIGAILGSVLGSLVNTNVVFTDTGTALRALLTASIFAVIIVVAFARKNSVQQIVSVEDFWGGMFIGFLVGYSGESFVSSIIGGPGK
jgi:hypothetical protein